MTDLIQVSLGSLAWLPTPETRMVEVVNHYDRPLLAIIEQAGVQYMARCVMGEMSDKSVWVYARIDETTERVLLCEGTPEQIDETADDVIAGGVVVSLVQHDQIVFAAPVDVDGGEPWSERLLHMSSSVVEAVSRVSEDAADVSRFLVHAR